MSRLDNCRKSDLCDWQVLCKYYDIQAASSLVKRKLRAAVLNTLVERGVLNSPVVVAFPGSAVAVDPPEGGAAGLQPADLTAVVQHCEVKGKPFTLLPFDPLSADTSPGSRLHVQVKVCLTCRQLETQEMLLVCREEREFQLLRELGLRKLEAETAIKMCQFDLQAESVPTSVGNFTQLSD